MSFGFSFGDFMVVLTLAKDLAVALSETRGVSVELQRLMTMLDSLQKAINNSVQVAKEWDLAHPDPSNKAPFNALVEEHKICKTLLENFWKDSEKYTKSIVNGQDSKVKRELAKIKWCMFHCDDAVILERNLSMHVMAINLYSCELRWYDFASDLSIRTVCLSPHSGILRNIANTNSAALAVVERNVSENTKLLQCIQRKIMRFFTQTPSAGLFPHDAPLTLLDAIGRELPIHFYLTGSFSVSSCRIPSFVPWVILLICKRCFTASLSSYSKISVVMPRSCSGSTISQTKTAKEPLSRRTTGPSSSSPA
jgi:hypothetical protein